MNIEQRFKFNWKNFRRILLGVTFILWIFFLVTLSFAAGDFYLFGFFEEERWYAITGNVAFLLLTGIQIFVSRQPIKKRLANAIMFAGLFIFSTLVMSLEAPILALFGSPNWESVQKWAEKNHPKAVWAQEPFRVTRSACYDYCIDVQTWEKIREILTGDRLSSLRAW